MDNKEEFYPDFIERMDNIEKTLEEETQFE